MTAALLRFPSPDVGLMPTRWTPERVETVTRLWASGYTAQGVAAALGPDFSRNAVIGKLNRLHLLGANTRRKTTEAPLNREAISVIRNVVHEVIENFSLDASEQRDHLEILVASLFAGTRCVCIAKSFGFKNVFVLDAGKRLYRAGIWSWSRRRVSKFSEEEWFGPHGDLSLVLDAMVGAGTLTKKHHAYGLPEWDNKERPK